MKPIKHLLFIAICLVFSYVIIDSVQHIQAEIYHRNGFIKKERGYPKLANIDFNKASKLIPWENHYRLQFAKSLEATASKFSNEYQYYINLAIKEYETLIESDPLNPWFKARLGLIYHDLYKKTPTNKTYQQLAQTFAKAATDSDPQNPLFTLHYAHFLYTYNNLEESKRYYLKTLAYDNDLTEAHFNIAAIYDQENNSTNAIKHHKIVNKQLLKMEARYRKNPTLETIKQKIERFQNSRIRVAEYYLKNNNNERAYETIKLIPISVEKYELLASYYEQQNQASTAISLYNQLKKSIENDIKKTTSPQRIQSLEKKLSAYDQKINQLAQ